MSTKCGSTGAYGTTNAELNTSREAFKAYTGMRSRLAKFSNGTRPVGKVGQFLAIGASMIDRIASKFLTGSNVTESFEDHGGWIEVNPDFTSGLSRLGDTQKGLFATAGRNIMAATMGGGTFYNLIERFIVFPNRQMDLAFLRWSTEWKKRYAEWVSRWNIEPRSEHARQMGRWLEQSYEKDGEFFYPVGAEAHIQALAEYRALMDELHSEVDSVRIKQGRAPLGYIQAYWPHVLERTKAARLILEEDAEPYDSIIHDYARTPPVQARVGKLEEADLEYDVTAGVMDEYIDFIGRDMFHTENLRYNKAYIEALEAESMRRKNIGRPGLDNMIADLTEYNEIGYSNRRPAVTKGFENVLGGIPAARFVRDKMVQLHRQLQKATFLYNWKWSMRIQGQSFFLIPVRYGIKNTFKAIKLTREAGWKARAKEELYALEAKNIREGGMAAGVTGGKLGGKGEGILQKKGILVEKLMRETPGGWRIGRAADVAEQAGTWLSRYFEENLSMVAAAAAEIDGQSRNLEGRALTEYKNTAIMRTQSMYNFEDRAGLLQAKEVGALVPFQSFAFEMFNWMREIGIVDFDAMNGKIANIPLVGKRTADALERFGIAGAPLGRVGHYAELDLNKSQFARMTWSLRFHVAMRLMALTGISQLFAHNIGLDEDEEDPYGPNKVTAYARQLMGTDEPWGPEVFVPFSSVLSGGNYGRSGSGILPAQYVSDLTRSVSRILQYGDPEYFWRWFARYHVPGGSQLNRIRMGVDAMMEGEVTDIDGRTMFKVDGGFTSGDEAWTTFLALYGGPAATPEGSLYYNTRERDNLKKISAKALAKGPGYKNEE